MRLPIHLLLYLVSAGLFGVAGWIVYQAWPEFRSNLGTLHDRAYKEGQTLMASGEGKGASLTSWVYGSTKKEVSAWWGGFRDINLIGKLPPPPINDPGKAQASSEPPPPPVKPIEEILELVAVMYDGEKDGSGGRSHVVVRYKPEANVTPPDWYVKENSAPTTGARTDIAANPAGTPKVGPNGRPPAPGTQPGTAPPVGGGARPSSAMPLSGIGKDMLQRVWVAGDGTPRFENTLWPPYSHIKLVRIASHGQSAYFVRTPPPPRDGKPPESVPAPKEEEVFKTAAGLSPDIRKALVEMGIYGAAGPAPADAAKAVPSTGQTTWIAEDDTRKTSENAWNVGLKDEQAFRENPDRLYDMVTAESYVSKVGSGRGVKLTRVDPDMSRRFGVQAGEVIVAVNNVPVDTKSAAVNEGRKQYDRGVRTFVVRFLSNGAYIERTYTAPDRK